MLNVAPSRALARRARQLLTIGFAVGAVGVFIAIVGLALFVIPLAAPGTNAYNFYFLVRVLLLLAGIVVFLIGVGVAVRAVTIRKDNDLAMITGRFLGQYLDSRYHFIRNIRKPSLGYIDAVLVGPPGALVFRILDSVGRYTNEGASWLKHDARGQTQTADIDPTREAVEDVKALRQFLAGQRLGDVPVYGIVVFTKEQPAVQLVAREPVVPITTLSALITNLGGNYLAKERMDAAKVSAVVRLLYDE